MWSFLVIALHLSAVRLAQADDPDVLAAHREHQAMQPFTDGTLGHPATFAIILSLVFDDRCLVPGEILDQFEGHAVVAKVAGGFIVVPLLFHMFYCSYNKTYGQGFSVVTFFANAILLQRMPVSLPPVDAAVSVDGGRGAIPGNTCVL